jgi:hypothetical protein
LRWVTLQRKENNSGTTHMSPNIPIFIKFI